MRTTIILLMGLVTFLNACKNCECTPENTLTMNDTTFNNQFECLDLEFLEQNNMFSKLKVLAQTDYYLYEERYDNGVRKIYIDGGGNGNYKLYLSINREKHLSAYKLFYPDGKIKEKCLQNDFGFLIGIFYKFNESGRLIESIDMDKGFDFTFEQLKEKLTKEEKILFDSFCPKDDGGGGVKYPIGIRRFSDPAPRWYVSFPDTTNSANGAWGTSIEIVYNGKTGEQISKDFIRIM